MAFIFLLKQSHFLWMERNHNHYAIVNNNVAANSFSMQRYHGVMASWAENEVTVSLCVLWSILFCYCFDWQSRRTFTWAHVSPSLRQHWPFREFIKWVCSSLHRQRCKHVILTQRGVFQSTQTLWPHLLPVHHGAVQPESQRLHLTFTQSRGYPQQGTAMLTMPAVHACWQCADPGAAHSHKPRISFKKTCIYRPKHLTRGSNPRTRLDGSISPVCTKARWIEFWLSWKHRVTLCCCISGCVCVFAASVDWKHKEGGGQSICPRCWCQCDIYIYICMTFGHSLFKHNSTFLLSCLCLTCLSASWMPMLRHEFSRKPLSGSSINWIQLLSAWPLHGDHARKGPAVWLIHSVKSPVWYWSYLRNNPRFFLLFACMSKCACIWRWWQSRAKLITCH